MKYSESLGLSLRAIATQSFSEALSKWNVFPKNEFIRLYSMKWLFFFQPPRIRVLKPYSILQHSNPWKFNDPLGEQCLLLTAS
jgi:hypothetical protein